jgi:hypothetical protein
MEKLKSAVKKFERGLAFLEVTEKELIKLQD